MFFKLTALTLAALIAVSQAAPGSRSNCVCPDYGEVTDTAPAIQCAYPDGACTYDHHGALLNTVQSNCEKRIKFNKNKCPKDRTDAEGVLVNHLISYGCAYPTLFLFCAYDATGALDRDGSDAPDQCPPAVSPCFAN